MNRYRTEQPAPLSRIDSPSRNALVLYIERLKGDDQQSFVIASKKLYGFYTHFTNKRSVPCWENHDWCEGGHSEETMRENFLVQAWSLKKNRMVFLYLTPGGARQLEDQVKPGTPLLGLPIIVTRTRKDNGRLNVQVSEFVTNKHIAGREIDPWESIMSFLKVPKAIRDQRRSLGSIPKPLLDVDETDECLKTPVSVLGFNQRNGCLSGKD